MGPLAHPPQELTLLKMCNFVKYQHKITIQACLVINRAPRATFVSEILLNSYGKQS